MAKTIKRRADSIHAPLVITGYTLFALLVLSTFLSTTIPFATIIAHPHSIKINAIVAMVALTVGALLPVLTGYFIGDKAVRSKSKLSHHFNGMLFGLLAYWWMTLVAAFGSIPVHVLSDNNARLMLTNLVPSISVAIISVILAVMHARSKQAHRDVIEYRPFVAVLLVSVIAMPLVSVINNFMTNSVSVYTFVTPLLVVAVGFVVYLNLVGSNLSKLQRVAWSAVALSVLFVAVFVVSMFESALVSYFWQPTMEVQSVSSWIAFIAALIAWGAYWTIQRRGILLGKKKKTPRTKKRAEKANAPKQERSARKIVIVTLLVLVLAPLLVAAFIYLAAYLKTEVLKHTLGAEASTSRMAHAEENDAVHQAKVDLLYTAGIVDGSTPVLIQKLDTCTLVGQGTGWVYTGWSQVCAVQYREYVPTDMSRAEVVKRLADTPGVYEAFGVGTLDQARRDCSIFKQSYAETLRYFSGRTSQETCATIVYETTTPGDIDIGNRSQTHTIRAISDQDVRSGQAYLQVESWLTYYESDDLGCRKFMCGPPIEEPVPDFKE